MAYNPQNPPLDSLLFLIILLVMTQISIIAARQAPPTAMNSGMINPEGIIDGDGTVLVPGVGKFMIPSLGGITGKIDDSQGFGGIIGPYIPGDESSIMSNTEVKATGPYFATIPSPDPDLPSPSFDHPGVKISKPSGRTSSTSTSLSFNDHGVTNSERALPNFYHHEVTVSEPATLSTSSTAPSPSF